MRMIESKVAEVKLTYSTNLKFNEQYLIRSSSDVYHLLMQYVYDRETIEYRESFKVILLNRANRVLGFINLFEGGTAGTVVDVKMVLQAAILANASSIILSHNHPSGTLYPSEQDKTITCKIKDACRILEISLHDHVIATSENYFSFADEGIL